MRQILEKDYKEPEKREAELYNMPVLTGTAVTKPDHEAKHFRLISDLIVDDTDQLS